MKIGVQALKKTQQQSKELSMLHHLGYNKKLYNRRDEGAVSQTGGNTKSQRERWTGARAHRIQQGDTAERQRCCRLGILLISGITRAVDKTWTQSEILFKRWSHERREFKIQFDLRLFSLELQQNDCRWKLPSESLNVFHVNGYQLKCCT